MPNAKVLSEKQAIVAELTEKIQKATAGVIVDYKGITVEEDTALRKECRENAVDYAVVKNTLLRFAFNNTGLNDLDDLLNGTILAHTDGQVPNLMVKVPEVNEFYLGELFYFFEFACGVSGYLLGVNPFNQPGVESYKKNMFALLGKPGYEAQREELLKRL